MIELHGMGSPNVIKVAITLEEIGRPYELRYVAALQGANFAPEYLALNPLGKIPVIVDHDGAGPDQPIFESGAILIYLAETYAPELLAPSGYARWEALKWLMVQMSVAGPMLGQVNHFQLIPSESKSYAAARYEDQAARVYGNYEKRLSACPWVAGDAYSIADIAMFPWAGYLERHGFNPEDYPNLIAWRDKISERRPVKRAYTAINALEQKCGAGLPTEKQSDRFFGRRQPGPAADFAAYAALGPISTVRTD